MSTLVTREILQRKLASHSRHLRLVEVLGPAYFARGHLPTAINIPLEGFEENAKKTLAPDDEIVLYCASLTCQNSHVAARKLEEMGYRNVAVFAGGKAAWTEASLALEVAS